MQSSFTVHEMDSASEPPSPMAAAASEKRKFRTCLHCTTRMPSIDFDTHTLCIECRHQVCDLTVHCDECRDWSDTKCSAFVKYNRTLKAKRDYKGRRRARLSGAAQSPSDQSVYDTDTEVPSLDEPLPSVQVQSDIVECVVSQECVVSEAPSTEAGPSDILYVTSGDRFEQLASSLLSKMNELQSDRGRLPPVQSHSSVGSSSRPIVAATDYLGVSDPPQGFIYLTLSTQFSGSPWRPCLTKPLLIGYSPMITRCRIWRRPSLPLVWRSARFAIGGFSPFNSLWIRLRPFPGTWKMLSGPLLSYVGRFAPLHHSLGFRHRTTQRRPFSLSSSSRGRTHASPRSTPQHSPASSSSKRFPPQKKSSDPPEETWGFSEVGVCPLAQHRRLSGPFLASMGGSGSGCLGRGGLARGIQDPFLPTTSFVRPTPPHAILYPVFHQEKSLGAGVPGSPPQASHRTGSSDSRLLQSPICGPEGFRGVAPHHRPVYPEHVHRISALSYGDSSVRPPFHSPRRLDDLIGSAGRVPSGSSPPGIASVSSLHHGRSSIPVQGTVLRADNCPSGLYKADGSNIRHSPSLRYQDAQIPR